MVESVVVVVVVLLLLLLGLAEESSESRLCLQLLWSAGCVSDVAFFLYSAGDLFGRFLCCGKQGTLGHRFDSTGGRQRARSFTEAALGTAATDKTLHLVSPSHFIPVVVPQRRTECVPAYLAALSAPHLTAADKSETACCRCCCCLPIGSTFCRIALAIALSWCTTRQQQQQQREQG